MIGKIIIGIVGLILLLAVVIVLSVKFNESEPAPVISANFVDLNKIEKISKYRSCVGHVTVPQNERESKRSMKHYFEVKSDYNKHQW